MIIIISGMSGSGKSYLSKNLSKKLGYKVIHASSIFKDLVAKKKIQKTSMNKGWYELSDMDNKRKQNKELDKELDSYLLDLIEKNKNLIIDSWTMPYLSKKGIKVWVETSFFNRAKRVSLRDNISFNKAIHLVLKKDNFSKSYFKKLYGFEFSKDLSVFDFKINTDNLDIQEVYEKTYKKIKLYF